MKHGGFNGYAEKCETAVEFVLSASRGLKSLQIYCRASKFSEDHRILTCWISFCYEGRKANIPRTRPDLRNTVKTKKDAKQAFTAAALYLWASYSIKKLISTSPAVRHVPVLEIARFSALLLAACLSRLLVNRIAPPNLLCNASQHGPLLQSSKPLMPHNTPTQKHFLQPAMQRSFNAASERGTATQ